MQRASLLLGSDRPSEFRSHPFEAIPANPKVDTLLPFGVVGVVVAPTLLVCLLPLRKTFAVVTNAGKAECAVIMCPALMWPVPLLPLEGSVAPESELILPPLRDFFEFSQIAH